MIKYEDKEDLFEFEKYKCFEKPEIWKNEALGLFASAQVLYEFDHIQSIEVFGQEKKPNSLFSPEITNKRFWYHRIIGREKYLLLGLNYSMDENLLVSKQDVRQFSDFIKLKDIKCYQADATPF